jgi:hypothetical protein
MSTEPPIGQRLAANVAAQKRGRDAERAAWDADAPARRLAELFAALQSRAAELYPGTPLRFRSQPEGYDVTLGGRQIGLSHQELQELRPEAWPALETRIYEALGLGEPPAHAAGSRGAAWVAAVVDVWKAAHELAAHDLPLLLERAARAEALAPVLDPTLWLRKSADLAHDRAWLEAALPLWRHYREALREARQPRPEDHEPDPSPGV